MTLATHIAIAAALTKPVAGAHPVLLFTAGLASHYLSDAIPHWDYSMHSIGEKNNGNGRRWNFSRSSWFDIAKTALDYALGMALVLLVLEPHSSKEFVWILIATTGGVLPDFLQALYLMKFKFLKPHQRFHDFMHTKIKLGSYPWIGIPFQLLILGIFLYCIA